MFTRYLTGLGVNSNFSILLAIALSISIATVITFFVERPSLPGFYLKRVDLDVTYEKWSKLLDGGIDSFYALWYVDNVSGLIERNNIYPDFGDYSHLNYKYFNVILNKIIMSKSLAYKIHNKDELLNKIDSIKIKLQKKTNIK